MELVHWVMEHDLLALSNNLGKYFTSYLEFAPAEAVEARMGKRYLETFCSTCNKEMVVLVPTNEKKEWFREEMRRALVGAPSNMSPNFKHFWFHSRCSECGSDISLMRS